jgi:hypothetical protein
MYTLESKESVYNAEKWFNSIKLVKDMGDLQNLDPNRYQKLNVFTRNVGTIIFRDYELLLDKYETKICGLIVTYKYDKIFNAWKFYSKEALKLTLQRTTSLRRKSNTQENEK